MEGQKVGPFLVQKRLGSKRQRVYRAFQKEQNREVALKFISLPPTVSRESGLRKIQKEVRFLQKLSHPNLAKFLGAGIESDKIFFAIELIDGESLAAILTRRGRLAWDLAVEYARQLAKVLGYLHQQDLLHCKLTPDKILLENRQVKLTDLRLNRSRKRRWDAREREELEIAAYMAPEQLSGEGATEQSDLYSVGAIIYEMVTGKIPYPPETLERMTKRKRLQTIQPISQIVPDCPIWLDKVVDRLLNPDPKKRYRSAEALVLALDEVKKIDQNQTSAAVQMAGGFNALTAGADKTEARRLLGKQAPGPEPDPSDDDFSFAGKWTTVLLGTGLAVGMVILLVGFLITYVPLDTRVEAAEKVLENPEATVSDMIRMERDLTRLVKRNPESEQAKRADELIDQIGERRLMRLAKRGRKGLHSPDVKVFIQAYQDWAGGKQEEAILAYRGILNRVEEDDRENAVLRKLSVKLLTEYEDEYEKELDKRIRFNTVKGQEKRRREEAVDYVKMFDGIKRFATKVESLKQTYPELRNENDEVKLEEPGGAERQ